MLIIAGSVASEVEVFTALDCAACRFLQNLRLDGFAGRWVLLLSSDW